MLYYILNGFITFIGIVLAIPDDKFRSLTFFYGCLAGGGTAAIILSVVGRISTREERKEKKRKHDFLKTISYSKEKGVYYSKSGKYIYCAKCISDERPLIKDFAALKCPVCKDIFYQV